MSICNGALYKENWDAFGQKAVSSKTNDVGLVILADKEGMAKIFAKNRWNVVLVYTLGPH